MTHQTNSSVNVPWPEKGMGDADYIHAFQKVIMPIAMEFAPDLVISAVPSFFLGAILKFVS